ncbi:MAG: flagellar basal body P-ring formation protein FlgA [Hydrogenophilaceae bacterium]|nr:flagellar basal body P-ring formation protein FlgA [Hydrogenophilaceae bacterium]
MFLLRSLTLSSLFFASACLAQDGIPLQSPEAVSQAAARYLEAQLKNEYPDLKAQVSVRSPDPRLRLAQCRQLQFALTAGSDLQGAGSLGAHCEAPQAWTFYLSYRIDLKGPALVTTRPLPARESIKARDVEVREIEFSAPPGSYLRQAQQAVGLLAKRPLQAGQPLTFDLLAKPLAIRSGQKVRIVVQQPGFSVSQECTAMTNANVGELVRCKAPSGRILQGIATEAGTIQVKP